MKAILRSYFYRLFRDKVFYIGTSIVFFLGLIIAVVMRLVLNDQATFAFGLTLGLNGGVFLGISSTIPWIDLLFFTILGAIRYRKETVSGAMRNYIVSGYSRKQIFNALYVGNIAFYLCLFFALLLGSILPFIGAPFGVASGEVGSFFGLVGLNLLSNLALMTFVYFTFVLLQGHGFSGSMGIIIYAGLSLFGTILTIVVGFNLNTIDKVAAKVLFILNGLLVPGNRSTLSSGYDGTSVRFDSIPGESSLSLFNALGISDSGQHVQEVVQEIRSIDWGAFNVTTTIVTSLVILAASYFFGLLLNEKRDLK